MKPGLRPRMISQIFAPVPAARSRCLSTFVAIARQSLPLAVRYEASHLLLFLSVILLVGGFLIESVVPFGATMILIGWGVLVIAGLSTLSQNKLVQSQSRSKLIRQLDDTRRSVGLDDAILPESLEFLEATAQQWERIEHALQSQMWGQQDPLRRRIDLAAHNAMEDIVILECGSVMEAGLNDLVADQTLAEKAFNLKSLADHVDATSAAMTTYPRKDFDSSGVPADGVLPELDTLEQTLAKLGQGIYRFTDDS